MNPLYRTIVWIQYRPAGRALDTAILLSLVLLILASPAWPDEPLRIGILLSLSGANESLGRRVQMVVADAGSDPTRATCVMFRLVERDRVSCVIGDVRTSSTIAASHYAERRRIPLISLAGVPSCVAKERRFTVWTGVPDKAEATWTAMACRTKLGAGTAAVICDKSEEYSITVAREFRKAFVCMGGRIAWQSIVGAGESNFEDCLKRAKTASPDVLFAPLAAASVALLAKQAKIMGLASTIVTTGWAEHRELIEAGGRFVEGLYIVSGTAASLEPKEYRDEPRRGHHAVADRKRVSQNLESGDNRGTSSPSPCPSPSGRGDCSPRLVGSLSLWERVGVRVPFHTSVRNRATKLDKPRVLRQFRNLSVWVQKGSEAYMRLLEAIERARSTDAEKICAALRQRHGWPRSSVESYSTSDICGVGLCLRRVENGRFILIGGAMRTCHSTNTPTNQETPPQPSVNGEGEVKDRENCLGSTEPLRQRRGKPSPR